MTKEFKAFLECVSFYHGYARYGQFPGNHVFTATIDFYDEKLYELMQNLDGGDCEALDASNKINMIVKEGDCFIGSDDNPIKAIRQCTFQIRSFFKIIGEHLDA